LRCQQRAGGDDDESADPDPVHEISRHFVSGPVAALASASSVCALFDRKKLWLCLPMFTDVGLLLRVMS
jgi:hypothetical protein